MAKTYRVMVFGKAGCDKCKTLNQRLEHLLAGAEWADFEKNYCDLETEEGLVAFCQAECINPQRIPAFVVQKFNEQSGRYEFIPAAPASEPGAPTSRLYGWLGLQTDYSDAGKGVLTPKMISAVLEQARRA